MGLRGPPPTPTAVLEARGSWRAKTNTNEPRPQPGAPSCPKGFTATEKKVWRAMAKILADMDVLTKADGLVLERYCRQLCRWRACEDFIAKQGMSYALKSLEAPKSGYIGVIQVPGKAPEYVLAWVEYPQVRESHRLHKALKETEDRFGLSPAARTRIRALSETGPKLYGEDEEAATLVGKFFGDN